MTVTQLLRIPDPFATDDEVSEDVMGPALDVLSEAGNRGLHLGVLRRFAMLGLGAPARSNRPETSR